MLKTEDAAKALGIYWMSQSDQFQFAFNVKCGTTITKRTVLSELAQVFDPLAFLSPMLILGKIFVQELWLLNHNWDEELPPSYAKQWQRYREELKLIEQCSLPRSVVPISFEVDTLELFGFSDASNRAYGGAIYARVRNKDGSISVRLVTAKSKVAPVRVTSLPRLELQGALLMVRLMAKVTTCIHLNVSQARYFTDSTIVLSWLSSHASRWTTFVGNRVAEIQESTNIRDWFKIESKLNQADIVSRGLYPNDLSNSTLWWHGPEFLRKPEDDWADTQWRCNLETVPEKRKGTFSLTKYWIINCRKLARNAVRSCIICFRLRPVLGNQLMGALPKGRVQGNIHPFQRAGLDFGGPIWMHFNMRGKRPVKVYLCVFVCFLTKACHIEIVSDLSANAFIAALKRFFARRGLSSDLYCDNATNFVGASRELDRNFDHSDQSLINDECSQRGINFHFIPPRSPHFGGLWESAVKIAKQLLVKCANSTALNYEDLSTAVTQVEAVMNSRPLHPLSADPNDLEALTPGHFLVGRPLNSLVEPWDETLVKLSLTNHWKRILVVHNMFWRRWKTEYLTLIQERAKWKIAASNIQLGTLALIAEDNAPPGQWLLGRVSELHAGSDGAVRVVTLKTKTGFLKRNVHRICPLPLESAIDCFGRSFQGGEYVRATI
ncbi:hypothetical protein ACLKA7_001302 [Drosophila subpalustris]